VDLSSVTFRPEKAPAPDLQPASRKDALPTLGAEREQVLKQHAHHHHSVSQDFAERHQALRATGREGPLPQAQPVNGVRVGSSAINQTHVDVAQQQDSVSLMSLSKKKGMTGDREVDEFIERHPEMAQWAEKLREARDAVLKNAAQDKQTSADSTANLQAKLETIANHLEGSPLAPALRMGDLNARKAFVAVASIDNPELEKVAQIVWDKASENIKAKDKQIAQNQTLIIHAQELQKEAERHGRSRAEALAAEKSPTLERLQALDAESARIQAAAKSLAPQNFALAQVIAQAEQRAEQKRRTELVAERIWQLQVQVEIQRGREGEQKAAQKLDTYLQAQKDLLEGHPGIRLAIEEHQLAAQQEGKALRLRCDSAAQLFYKSVDGLGSTEDETRKALQNRTLLELQIISERYQEMYQEDILEAIDGDYDGDEYVEMSGYLKGSASNPGEVSRKIDIEKIQIFSSQQQDAQHLEAVIIGSSATQAAVLLQNAISLSDNLTTEILRIGQQSGVSVTQVQSAAEQLGQPHLLEEARARLNAERVLASDPLTQQLKDAEISVLDQYMQDGAASDQAIAEYAVTLAAEHGRALGAAEASEVKNQTLIESLKTSYLRANEALTPLLSELPDVVAKVDAIRVNFIEQGRLQAAQTVYLKYGEELGLTDGSGSEGEIQRQQIQQKLELYRQSIIEVLPQSEKAEAELALALKMGKDRGKSIRAEAQKVASQMHQGVYLLGTDYDLVYGSLQNKSSQVLALANSIYQKEHSETFTQAVEGDFSGVDRDKALALLNQDSIGEKTADIQIALSGFWGVDKELLNTTLRSLSNDERPQVGERFVEREYHLSHTRQAADSPDLICASSFEESLEFKLKGDALVSAQALYKGDYALADAAELHEAHEGAVYGYNDDSAAIKLSSFKDADGFLDTARVSAAADAYNKHYKIDLRSLDQERSDGDAAWLAALARCETAKAAELQFSYGMAEEDKALVREVFEVPAQLRSQIWHEQTQGQLSASTQQKWSAWIARGEAVKAAHPEWKTELIETFNSHDRRILETIINHGVLSRADVIADACEGMGTDLDPIRDATAGLTKNEAQELIQDFRAKGYGDLVSYLDGDLSGDDYFDIVEINLAGIPETTKEALALAEKRFAHETGWALSVCIFGNTEEKMKADLETLRKLSAGDLALSDEADAVYRRFGIVADAHRQQKNMIADTVSNVGVTVIMVGGTIVICTTTLGTGAPMAVMLWTTASAGVWRMGSKAAFKGLNSYSGEAIDDLAMTAVDFAALGMTKVVPVGRLVQNGTEQVLGRTLASAGRQAMNSEGRLLTGEALYHSLAQSNRLARMAVGAMQGSVDAAVMAPIQAAGFTALNEQTWHEGIGSGLEQMLHNASGSIAPAFAAGFVAGSAFRFRTPAEFKLAKPVSMETANKIRSSGQLGEEGTAHLMQREQARGFVTKGDIKEAELMNKALSPADSEKLLAKMRANPERFTEGDVQLFENRLNNGGKLSQYDLAVVEGKVSPQGFAAVTQKGIEKRIAEARAELARHQADARGFESPHVKYAEGRLQALEDVHQQILANKPKPLVQIEPAPASSANGSGNSGTSRLSSDVEAPNSPRQIAPRVEPSIPRAKSPEELRLENGIKRYDEIMASGKFSNGEAIDPADIGLFKQEKAALEAQLQALQKAASPKVAAPKLDPEVEASLRKARDEAEASFRARQRQATSSEADDADWSLEREARHYGSSSETDIFGGPGPKPGDSDWNPFGSSGDSSSGSRPPRGPGGGTRQSSGSRSAETYESTNSSSSMPRQQRGNSSASGPQAQLKPAQANAGIAVMEPEVEFKPLIEVELPTTAPRVADAPEVRPSMVPKTVPAEVAPSVHTPQRLVSHELDPMRLAATNQAVRSLNETQNAPAKSPLGEEESVKNPARQVSPSQSTRGRTTGQSGESDEMRGKLLNEELKKSTLHVEEIRKRQEKEWKQTHKGGHSKRHSVKIEDGLGETEIEIERGDD
jgi:hypothetical protein